MLEHIPNALHKDAEGVLPLLNSDTPLSRYITEECRDRLDQGIEKGPGTVVGSWMQTNKADFIQAAGAVTEYALRQRGIDAPYDRIFEETAYAGIVMDHALAWVYQNVPWEQSIPVQSAVITGGLLAVLSINALIKRLSDHGSLVAVAQRQRPQFDVGGRVAVVTRSDYDIRYQPADGVDPTPWERYDECWTDGITDREYGYLMKQFRTAFPAYVADFMLSLADEDQWQPA